MPGIKRKASRASPYESPSKITKETSTTTVSRTLSVLRKETTVSRVPLPVPTWPSLKGKTGEKKDSEKEPLPLPRWPTLKRKATEKKDSATPGTSGDLSPPPGLRRSATLPVAEEESKVSKSSLSSKKTLSKKGSKVGELITVPSLPKTSSVVDGDDTVTTLKRLPSGSSIGKTTSFSGAPPAIRKELSKVPSMRKSTSSTGKAKESGTVEISLEKTPSLTKSLSKGSMRKGRSVGSSAGTVDGDGGMSSAVPLPPGGMMEIVFSFDTTGSMYSCLDQVRGRIQDMIQRLQADIPGIRIAVVAHGDYCDRDKYVIEWIDFGATVPELCKFVKEIDRTGGGDFPECYELVLRRVQSVLSWTPGSQRSLVVIGDATPHGPQDNPDKIDWREECQALKKMGVKIYAVQALNQRVSDSFYSDMAKMTSGKHLKLDQFSNIFDMIMAICYREKGSDLFEAFEEEVRDRHGGAALDKDLEGLFGTLRDDTGSGPSPLGMSAGPLFSAPFGGTTAHMGFGSPVHVFGSGTSIGTSTLGGGLFGGVAGTLFKPALPTTGGLFSTIPEKVAKKKSKASKESSKQFRENTDDGDLLYKSGSHTPLYTNLVWSEWMLAMTKEKIFKKSKFWKPRRKKATGYRRIPLFKKDNGTRAIYEIGIKAPWSPRRRVYAVYYKATKGFSEKIHWDEFLLKHVAIEKEVDDVIRRGGKIYVRRGVFTSTSDKIFEDTLKYLQNNISYPWNEHRKGSKVHRTVKKSKFVMSGVHGCVYPKNVKKTKRGKQTAKTKKVTKSNKGAIKKAKTKSKKSPKTNKSTKGKKSMKAKTTGKTKSAIQKKTTKAKVSTKKETTKRTKPAAKKKVTKAKPSAQKKNATKLKKVTKVKVKKAVKSTTAAKVKGQTKAKNAAMVKALLKGKKGAKSRK